jgi:hypothetical protein
VLEGVLGGERERRYVVCDVSDDGAELVGLYRQAVQHLDSKLGRPNYSGRGKAYPTGSEGSDPGVFIDAYSRSLEISWWKTDQGLCAALVSSHDAMPWVSVR